MCTSNDSSIVSPAATIWTSVNILKGNCDIVIYGALNLFGFGIILRDYGGNCLILYDKNSSWFTSCACG